MPELPECEANRRRVADHALNRTIEAVRLGNDTTHVDLPSKSDRDRFVGTQFTKTRRHGKIIFAGSASGPWIAVHLGMTGSLRPYDADEEAPDYVRITFEFEGDRRLAYRCPRKLGWVQVTESPEAWVKAKDWGPDAMEIDRDTFAERIGSTRGAVKSALMDQRKLAGVGNLWSDETLFQTGIMPDVKGSDLTDAQIDDLFEAMREVLQAVLDANADYSKLPGHWLIGSRKKEGQCPRCSGTIHKRSIGGRSAYFCDSHQGDP